MTVNGAQIAAGMRLDLSNAAAFLARLAHTLEAAVADRTKIQRHGADVVAHRARPRPRGVFVAKREAHGVLAQHKRMVRGIALKTATHPLDRWVEMVTTALAAHLSENARTRPRRSPSLFAHVAESTRGAQER